MKVQTDFRLEYSSVSSFSKYKRFKTQVRNIELKHHAFRCVCGSYRQVILLVLVGRRPRLNN